MARKSKKEDQPKEKHKIEFNLQDGVSWHDFVGFFLLIFQFFWKILKIIAAPVFYIYAENVRMYRFMRASGHERVMTDDERYFVETIPFIYTMTGLIGGILLGFFAVTIWSDPFVEFFRSIDFDVFVTFFNWIGSAIGWIFDLIVNIILGIADIFSWLAGVISSVFNINPFLAFLVLAFIGLVVLLIWIAINELGLVERVVIQLKRFFYWIIGSPDRFRLRINSLYRRMNHALSVLLVGRERLHTRTQIYFKKVVVYTGVLSIWSFGAGIYVGTNPDKWGGIDSNFKEILFISTVLFVAGVIAGTIFFAFIARFFDLFSRAKYISPEFIKEDGSVNREELRKYTDEDEKRVLDDIRVDEEKLAEADRKAKERLEQLSKDLTGKDKKAASKDTTPE